MVTSGELLLCLLGNASRLCQHRYTRRRAFIILTMCRRLGFAFHRYQDRLPEWARRPAKKSVKKPAIQQQPHLQKHLQQLEGGDHDKLAKDIQVLTIYVLY